MHSQDWIFHGKQKTTKGEQSPCVALLLGICEQLVQIKIETTVFDGHESGWLFLELLGDYDIAASVFVGLEVEYQFLVIVIDLIDSLKLLLLDCQYH
jgi:hypothetical protein